MAFDKVYFSIGMLDRLSYQDTVIHRLDPRAKVIFTLLFVFTVVSYSKYDVTALAPLFLFPVLMIALGDIPVLFLLKKIILVSPFALFVGISNIFFDSGTVVFFGMKLSAGWVSFFSILVKFVLTVSAALLLIATTSFPGVCHALRQLGLPALFVSQLLFLYRYLFVLMEEAMRIIRARDMRSFGRKSMTLHVAVRIIGSLFLRTVERAERIYGAMLSRGFQGDIPSLKRFGIRVPDVLFVIVSVGLLVLFRFYSFPDMIGGFIRELAR